jgi:hypothetical protein
LLYPLSYRGVWRDLKFWKNSYTNFYSAPSFFQDLVEALDPLGSGSVFGGIAALKQRPIAAMQEIARRAALSFPAASSGMKLLADL